MTGIGYVFHAHIQDGPNAHDNVGGDLPIRASNFRVGNFAPEQAGK